MGEDSRLSVDAEFVALCTFGDECQTISIRRSMSLVDVLEQLKEKFPQMNDTVVNLRYLVPQNRKHVTLTKDGDIANMCHVYGCAKVGVIDLEASRNNSGYRNENTSNSRRCTSVASAPTDARSGIDIGPSGNVVAVSIDENNSLESWRLGIRGEGQTFKNADAFREAMRNYSISICRDYKITKNDLEKVIVKCVNKDCDWRVYASRCKRDGEFAIRKCNLVHTCDSGIGTRGHPKAKSMWVAKLVKKRLRHTPSHKPKDIVAQIHENYGVQLQYHHAWRGREVALQEIHGRARCSYDQLRWFCSNVQLSNPGSIADYEVDESTRKFQRLFLCFKACLLGFHKGCRPAVFLDGSFIKHKYRGCLLSATGVDAENGLFPIAYAIVGAENTDNWEWFCWKFAQALTPLNGGQWNGYIFFSDRHRGLLKAVPLYFPGASHCYCVRHLVDNFKKEVLMKYPFKNKKYWCGQFWNAAKAMTIEEFNEIMNKIIASMPQSTSFIARSDPTCWANSIFVGCRWGMLTNNLAESFNSWVREARHLPITAMVDQIRIMIMEQMHERREAKLDGSTVLCPSPEGRLRTAYLSSRGLKFRRASVTKFELVDSDRTLGIDLEAKTCTCREWQVNGIPCKHACACIEAKGDSLYSYCDPCFSVFKYRLTYQEVINPIPNACGRPEVPNPAIMICAPDVGIQPGRPRTRRIPSQVLPSQRQLKCTRCKRVGHNRRTCQSAIPGG